MRGLRVLLACAALLGAPACQRSADGPTPPRSNLILVSVDTLRPDHLGAYGYDRPTSPELDAFAAAGAVFEQAVSTALWTLPSHASMLTGRYPANHGLRGLGSRPEDGVPTLAEALRAAGYRTVAFVNSTYFAERYGMRRGFDAFEYVKEDKSQVRPSLVTLNAANWLAAVDDEPFFLFLHVYDVHSDYRALPRFSRMFLRPYEGRFDGSTEQLIDVQDEGARIGPADIRRLIDLYDAGIRQTDMVLGQLFDLLDELELADHTLVIVTSDHGEEFFERGSVLHGSGMYDELFRVPLLVRGPGVPPGVRVPDPVEI